MNVTRNNGFTLVELLAVLGIVALLVLFVFPMVGSSLSGAHQARCAANLRQIHAANMLYAADHRHFVPAAADMPTTNRERWHGHRDSGSGPFDGIRGPLQPYLGYESHVRRCGAFRHAGKSANAFEASCGGYGYNTVGVGSRMYVAASSKEAYRTGMRPDQLLRSNQTIMFADTALGQPYHKPDHLIEYSFAEPYYFVFHNMHGQLQQTGPALPSIHFRHDGRANIVWVDGHVSAESPGAASANTDAKVPSHFLLGWPGDANNDLFKPF